MFNAHLWISLLKVEQSNGGGYGSGDDHGKHRKGRKGWYSVHFLRQDISRVTSEVPWGCCASPAPVLLLGLGAVPAGACHHRAHDVYPGPGERHLQHTQGANDSLQNMSREEPFTIENYLIKVQSVKNLFKENMTPFYAGISNQSMPFRHLDLILAATTFHISSILRPQNW